MEAEDVPDRE